jgi:hypothetical protein
LATLEAWLDMVMRGACNRHWIGCAASVGQMENQPQEKQTKKKKKEVFVCMMLSTGI